MGNCNGCACEDREAYLGDVDLKVLRLQKLNLKIIDWSEFKNSKIKVNGNEHTSNCNEYKVYFIGRCIAKKEGLDNQILGIMERIS
jgi:hypothetical protein